MEIPLNAQVECTDGVCGQSMYVLINPIGEKITHLVVRENISNTEYMVPIEVVSETIVETIRLHCSKAELEKMEPFIQTTFVKKLITDRNFGYGNGMFGLGATYYMPYVIPEITMLVPVETQQIPPGELAVHRGTRVEATDGYVGKVDEFVVNPENGRISHLVLREGHLWGQRDVIIPLSALDKPQMDTVFLKLNKQQIESLPNFPVTRRWS